MNLSKDARVIPQDADLRAYIGSSWTSVATVTAPWPSALRDEFARGSRFSLPATAEPGQSVASGTLIQTDGQGELGLDDFCGRGPDAGLRVDIGGGDVVGNDAFEVIDRSKTHRLRLWRVAWRVILRGGRG